MQQQNQGGAQGTGHLLLNPRQAGISFDKRRYSSSTLAATGTGAGAPSMVEDDGETAIGKMVAAAAAHAIDSSSCSGAAAGGGG